MQKLSPLLLAAVALAAAAGPARAQVMMALANNAAGSQVVFQFDAARPGTVIDGPNPVTGLGATQTLVGLDQSPITSRAYAIAINPQGTGAIYPIASTGVVSNGHQSFNFVAGTTGFGVDFDPASTGNDLRVVTSGVPSGFSANNYRFSIQSTTAFPEGTVHYGAGTTGTPAAVGLAYSNNVPGGGPGGARTAYVLDAAVQGLFTLGDANFTGAAGQVDPASGTLLNRVNLSGVTITDATGFDITAAGVAYLSTPTALYTLNLSTGAATLVGNFPAGLTVLDITTVPEPGRLTLCGLAALAGCARRRARAGPAPGGTAA